MSSCARDPNPEIDRGEIERQFMSASTDEKLMVLEQASKAAEGQQGAAVDVLLLGLSDDDPKVRMASLRGLMPVMDSRVIERVRLAAKNDPDNLIRGASLHFLGMRSDLESRDMFLRAIESDKVEIFSGGVVGLCLIQDRDALTKVAPHLKGDDTMRTMAAFESLLLLRDAHVIDEYLSAFEYHLERPGDEMDMFLCANVLRCVMIRYGYGQSPPMPVEVFTNETPSRETRASWLASSDPAKKCVAMGIADTESNYIAQLADLISDENDFVRMQAYGFAAKENQTSLVPEIALELTKSTPTSFAEDDSGYILYRAALESVSRLSPPQGQLETVCGILDTGDGIERIIAFDAIRFTSGSKSRVIDFLTTCDYRKPHAVEKFLRLTLNAEKYESWMKTFYADYSAEIAAQIESREVSDKGTRLEAAGEKLAADVLEAISAGLIAMLSHDDPSCRVTAAGILAKGFRSFGGVDDALSDLQDRETDDEAKKALDEILG
ncbi:MAG: HEAT repeat domain-containing protein [Planctomycetes bacterium]|nr:HEAT repeat domain-containing protein [Planctomycetota bacterium]